jgi:hypothetical protein
MPSGIEWFTRFDDVERGRLEQLVLAQLALHQPLGQAAGVDRRAGNLGQDVGQRPGMVLVAVSQDDRADLVPVLLEVADVGDDEIDAEHVGVGEGEATVDHEDVSGGLDGGDVLAHLAHPAERDDAQGIGHESS